MQQQQIKRRVTDFESFDTATFKSDKFRQVDDQRKELTFDFIGPAIIRAIQFRMWINDIAEPSNTNRLLLQRLVLGERNHINGPGILAPFKPSTELHVCAGEQVILGFSHPPHPCRIVGYLEVLRLSPL